MKSRKASWKSDSYISHIENGRMDLPCDDCQQNLLNVYRGIKIKSFQDRVRVYKKIFGKKDEFYELVEKMNEEQISLLNQFTSLLLDREKEKLCTQFFQYLKS